jgi:hypothetical protein
MTIFSMDPKSVISKSLDVAHYSTGATKIQSYSGETANSRLSKRRLGARRTVSSARSEFSVRRPRLECKEPKCNEIQTGKDSKQAPQGVVPGAAKQLCQGHEEDKERHKQQNEGKGVK